MRTLSQIILTVIVGSFLLIGCRSSKTAQSGVTSTTAERTLNERFDSLVAGYGKWDDVTMPVKVKLTRPKEISISGRLSMRQGKDILLSLRFLGMEVMNLYVTTDSVFASDKIHKYYLAESLESLTAGFPMTVGDMQDLLLGRAFILEHGTLSRSHRRHLTTESMGEYWAVVPEKSFNGIEYAFGIDSDDNLKAITSTRNGVTVLQCTYSSHKECPAGDVAGQIQISAEISGNHVAATIINETGSAKWNAGSTRNWKKPKGYKRIYGAALIKALTEQ